MNYSEAQKYLDAFIDNERALHKLSPGAFNLSKIKKLLSVMGDFHKDLKVIHIAGSKGKGSIAAMIAAILKESGYRVGLYTSPHINDVRERIRLPSLERKKSKRVTDIFPDAITPKEFSVVAHTVKQGIDALSESVQKKLTFFEVVTVMALAFFHQQKADWVILETGLGGRLDATNVTDAVVSAITTITYEHTNILGTTLTQIAQEKAAIIKASTRFVVSAQQRPAVKKVIRDRCRVLGFETRPLGVPFSVSRLSQNRQKQKLGIYCEPGKNLGSEFPAVVDLPLLGEHQQENVRVVLQVVRALRKDGSRIPSVAIRRGLRHLVWPLRFETICRSPLVVLDGAHTKISMKLLRDTLKTVYPQKKIYVILAIARDKDVSGISKEVQAFADEICFTRFRGKRAFNPSEAFLQETFKNKKISKFKNIQQSLECVLKQSPKNGLILVTGSLFAASEARKYMMKRYQKKRK